jgi:hypothetical protein
MSQDEIKFDDSLDSLPQILVGEAIIMDVDLDDFEAEPIAARVRAAGAQNDMPRLRQILREVLELLKAQEADNVGA